MANLQDHEPHGTHQTKKATASGWIGSALEYYDFFIYATAASLIFPQIFFPEERSEGRHHRLAGDLRRRLRRAARSAPSSSATGATRTAARRC